MIKILHCSDVHLGDLPGPVKDGVNLRREDTVKCMVSIVHAAMAEKPHVSIIAGDLFHRSRTWCDSALQDVHDAIDEFLEPLCRYSEYVFLLMGTDNHDNLRAFNLIRQRDITNLHVCVVPEIHTVKTKGGDVQILGLPGFDKGRLRSFLPIADKEDENRNATAAINEVLLGLGVQLDKSLPSVLVAHYTVAGAESESGSTFLAGQDVVLLPQTIDASGVTLACLGHIHKPQRIAACNTPTYYSGSINQITFGDEDIAHGFYTHNLGEFPGRNAGETVWDDFGTTFYPTPERRHCTLRLDEEDIGHFINFNQLLDETVFEYPCDVIGGTIVRVRYFASSEQDKALNKAALQKYLYDLGAFHVAEITAEEVSDEADAYEATADDTPAAALVRYMQHSEIESDDAARLMVLAEPILRKADDGRDANRQAGAFVPKRIEIRNYRSYMFEEFDFGAIRMAMVNGPNGVGKSSLFMDAIADCLFEESRDGQLGGWLRDGEKSGAITFEFALGGMEYRVARTRTASGKGTLLFSRRGECGEWVHDGDTTMKLTQAKIVDTLGMDCQTFCSIALIRQDAYGVFLETGKTERMETLSSLLDLGVYDRMEDGAKERAAEYRKEIADINTRTEVLREEISKADSLEVAESVQLEIIEKADAEISELDAKIAAAQREEALREEIKRQATVKMQEARNLQDELKSKEKIFEELEKEKAAADSMAQTAGAAERAAETISEARAELEVLAEGEARARSLTERSAVLDSSLKKYGELLQAVEFSRKAHRSTLERREEIEGAVKELERLEAERIELNARLEKKNVAGEVVHRVSTLCDTFVAEGKARVSDLKNQIELTKAQISTAANKADILADSECPVLDSVPSCRFLKDAVAAKDEIAGLEAALSELEASLAEVKESGKVEYDRFRADHDAAVKAYQALGDPLNDLRHLAGRMDSVKATAAFLPKLEAAAASIAELDKQEVGHWTAVQEAEAEISDINAQLPALQEKKKRADDLRFLIEENEAPAALLPKAAAAKATSGALADRMADLQADIGALQIKAGAAEQEAAEMQTRVPDNRDIDVDLGILPARRKEASDRQAAAVEALGGIKARLESVEHAREMAAKYAEDRNTAARHLNDYQTLAHAFGIDGIQYMIIRSIVPEITRRANEILAAMTGGAMAVDLKTDREQKNGKVVNSLDVWIRSITGGSRPYSSHSGGEKVKIALAVTLALADVKARRAGVQLGMLFIDEPPFLDASGTEAYADALVEMAGRNPGMRIIAISHDPSMKARFPQNIVVSAGDNGSVVAMAA